MMQIRQATVVDLPTMEACAQEFYNSSEVLGKFDIGKFISIWTKMFELGIATIFLLESYGEINGAIGGIVHPEIYGHEIVAEEFFWFISPDYRGSGIRLYNEFEKWAIKQGAAVIQMVHLLDLMPDKVSIFYKRIGFIPIETRYSKRLVAI